MDVNPVAVHEREDGAGIVSSIAMTIAKGNPVVATPSRSGFPKPAILEHAKVKTWATFEKSAQCWNINEKEGVYQICPARRSITGGWEADAARLIIVAPQPTPRSLAKRVVELINAPTGQP